MSDSEEEHLFGNVKETIKNLEFNKIHEKMIEEFDKEDSDDCIISSETPGAFIPMTEPDDSVIIVEENTTKEFNNITSNKRSRRVTRTQNFHDEDDSDAVYDPEFILRIPKRRRPARRVRKSKNDPQNLPVTSRASSGVNNQAKRGRGRHGQPVAEESLDMAANSSGPGEQSILDQFINSFTSKGRRVDNQVKRGRGRHTQSVPEKSLDTATNSSGPDEQSILDQFINSFTSRGRVRRSPRNHRKRARVDYIYSVGNTDEYPDELENIPLFHAKPSNDVSIVEDVSENKELCVKVHWQCSKVVKFKIRKFQKLTELYNYFSSQAKVNESNLLFVYNSQNLKPDDTPDSIKYSEDKLIDGGIVNKTSNIVIKREKSPVLVENGINLKFQYQNSKKPFLTCVTEDEKLSLAMIKCAEFLGFPPNHLRFEFDGDIVSGKQTAKDLELEGGECIDVKIIK